MPGDAVTGVSLFGKLPAHGDFVARGLAADERDRLDAWLSASLAGARDALGPAWEDRFDRAPPWRCVAGGSAGAICASQDAAGRRFPLLLRVAGVADAAAVCEDLLYRALGEGWTADRLAEEAAAIGEGAADAAPRWWTEGGEGFPPAALDGDHPPTLLSAMLGAPAGVAA